MRYFKPTFLLFLFLSFFTLSSFAEQATAPHTIKLTNGQILKIVMTIDRNEINAGRVALKQSANPRVRRFADMMISDHGIHLQDAQALAADMRISPANSAKSSAMQKKGKEELAKLESLQEHAFDVAYINAMVKGHTEALTLLETQLIPNASNPALMDFLKVTHDMVAHHLKIARELQE